ncbi:MAG: M56 family metallopeptidase, partial [Oscillospiraceae bacterium]|nr:M56 family metallopeptidase [Oscillospiraceae bacterium]
RRFKRAVPAEDGDARAWLEAHPLRRGLSLRRLEGLDSPLTYGVFRPVILIPEGFDLADGAAQLALEHEYVHARRFDPLLKLILTAALALHWFDPFVWLMYFLAGRDVELACDEAVLRGLGEDGRADYARALLSMAERRSPVPALRVSFGSNRTRERIAAIMKFRKRSALAVALAAVLTLGLAACAVTGPASAKKLPDGVERAVYDAVMEHNEGSYLRGEFACADVRILGFKTEDGRTTAYAMALYEEFKREDGEIKVVSGSHVPCVVTVEQGADGTCRAVEYREPRDGSLYAGDIKEIFPRSLRSKLDTQKYIDEQEAACLAKAEAFYAGLTERLYCLTHERDAVWLVGLDGAEKVYDLPEGTQTAAVAGSTLWYATEDELVRVDLADGSRREYALPENTWAGYYMYAEENAACIPLFTGEPGHASGAIYRFGDGGAERVTSGNVMSGTYPFAVDGRSIYYLTDGELLVREAPDGTVREFERPLLPLGSISVDGGRVYTAGSFGGCTSYDAATGGGERMETGAGGEIIHSCTAHGGWLYYPIGNPDMTGADDAALLMARRISDGKAVEYAKCTDAFTFYTLPFLVTFGEQGFVLDDGYQRDDFRYIPYYTADYTPTAVPMIDPEGYVISSREEMGAGFDPGDPAHAMNEEYRQHSSLEELTGMSGAAVKAQLKTVDELDAMHCEYTFALIEDYFGTAEETISVTALKSSFLQPGGVYYLLLTVRSEPATEHRFYGFVTYRFLVREYLLDGEPLLYFLDGFDLGGGERDNMGVKLREIAASMRAAGSLPTVDTKTLEEALDEGGLVEIVTVTALREDVRDFFTDKYNVPFDFTVDEVLNGKTLIVPDGFPMLAPLGTQPGDRFILVFPKGAKSPREASNYLVFSVNSEEAKTILARYPSAEPTPAPSTEPTPEKPDRIPQSHEDIVLGSTNIVTARYVETVQAFRGDEYVYEVREELKGSAGGGPLHVITSGYVDLPSAMPVSGDDVILFLSGYDSVYQEHVLYILTDIAEDTEAERSLIASLCAGGAPDHDEDGRKFTRSDDIGDILEVTESIFFVRPEEVFVVGTQAPTTTYTCTVLARLRGEPDPAEVLGITADPEFSEILIPFFNDTVTIGGRYLVLLAEHRERSKIYTLSSPYSVMTQEEAAQIPELRAILEEAGYDTPAGNTKR